MYLTILLVYLFCVVECNHLKLGRATLEARKIYDGVRGSESGSKPRYVTIEAPRNKLISAVYVTDLSPTNEGVAFVKSGGVGKKEITIGLTSQSQNSCRFQMKIYAERQDIRGSLKCDKDRVVGVELRSPGRFKNYVD